MTMKTACGAMSRSPEANAARTSGVSAFTSTFNPPDSSASGETELWITSCCRSWSVPALAAMTVDRREEGSHNVSPGRTRICQ